MRRLLLITLLCVATAAEAQAPLSFAQGVLAFEKKEWKEAERLMREAVAGNPTETDGTVRISGQWFETYVPHYFLARALAKQGKCREALAAFAESERQGITPAIGDFKRHLDTRGGCKPAATPKKEKVVGEVVVPFGEEEVAVKPPVTKTEPPPKVSATKPPPVPVPDRHIETRARLAAAVNAYLRGEYELTTRLLSGELPDRAAAAEAALFRAAARHALYRSGGEKDATLRQQFERDLRKYRELRPNGRPDPRVFSPGFIALAK
ncbi:MAG TPA: hypothetical protein VEK57_31280 [Thermoanaerobaculia bacterium]|nr:hypothetical protein [Thermoanaerobaculia bacterium]